MSDTIASQFIRHDLPGFTSTRPQQALEEAFRSLTIPFALKIHINHFTILIHNPPEVVLLAIDLHEYFVDVESITESLVFSLQFPRTLA